MATDFDLPRTQDRPRTVWSIVGIVLAVLGLGVAAPAVAGWEAAPDLHEAVTSAELTVAPARRRSRCRKPLRPWLQLVAAATPQPEGQPRPWRVPRQFSLLPPLRRGPPALLM